LTPLNADIKNKISIRRPAERKSSSTKIELSQGLFSNENYPVKDAYFGAGFHNFDFAC